MKLCKDCKHDRPSAAWADHMCMNPDYADMNPVTGDPMQPFCFLVRTSMYKCGSEAKGFAEKQKEEL